MPEALTEWKFLAFAHDRDLRGGLLEDKVVTAKDLMVQPNPPRFLREGDVLEFTVKVANQSATRQAGSVRLTLAAARTGKSVDRYFGNLVHGPGFRHSRQGVAEFLLAIAGSRCGGRTAGLQGGRLDGPGFRRRGRASCRSSRGGSS